MQGLASLPQADLAKDRQSSLMFNPGVNKTVSLTFRDERFGGIMWVEVLMWESLFVDMQLHRKLTYAIKSTLLHTRLRAFLIFSSKYVSAKFFTHHLGLLIIICHDSD